MMYDPKNPPIKKSQTGFVFPEFKTAEIAGGIEVLMIEDKSSPLVSLRLVMKSGSEYDDIPGSSHLAFKMLTNGTKSKPGSKFSAASEQLGSYIFSNCDFDDSEIWFTCLSEHFDDMLELMRQCVFEPAFDNDEFEKIKKRHLSNLSQNLSNPKYLSTIALHIEMFQGHPYGNPVAGFPNHINLLTNEDLIEAYEGLFSNSEKFFVVAGNFDEDDMLDRLENAFTGMRSLPDTNVFSDCLFPPGKSLILTHKEGPQSVIKLALPAIKRNHKDYPGLMLLNTVFGGYFNSRLNHLLREEKGITYGISSQISSKRYTSFNLVSTSVKADRTREAIDDIIKVVNEIRLKPIPKEEINIALQYLLGIFTRSIESYQNIASLIQSIKSYDLQDDYYNQLYKKLSSLKSTDLDILQKRYFADNNIVVSICGDIPNLKTQFSDWNNIIISEVNNQIMS